MSATLEKEKFQNFFDDAPAVEVPGRLFPVETTYAENKDSNYVNAAAEKVRELIEQKKIDGDTLIFHAWQTRNKCLRLKLLPILDLRT
jgi:HrpA-like RNA helicase